MKNSPHKPTKASGQPHLSTSLLALLLGLSGFAGLGYQVFYTHLMVQTYGASLMIFALSLSAFMAGLSMGNLQGGWLVARGFKPVMTYSLLEFGIAALGHLNRSLIQEDHSRLSYIVFQWIDMPIQEESMGLLVIAGGIFLQAALMGATVPVMIQGLGNQTEGLGHSSARVIGFNQLGASAGALGSSFVLLPYLGNKGTLDVLVGISLGVGALAWLISFFFNFQLIYFINHSFFLTFST